MTIKMLLLLTIVLIMACCHRLIEDKELRRKTFSSIKNGMVAFFKYYTEAVARERHFSVLREERRLRERPLQVVHKE